MNELIIRILPDIERITKGVTKNRDQQNELRQYCVIECYNYENVVKRLYTEKRLNAWIRTVVNREYFRMKNNVPTDEINESREIEDVIYSDLLEELKTMLTDIERVWLKHYLKEGSYAELHRRTGIREKYISQRIKSIIEKCKQLKSTLL